MVESLEEALFEKTLFKWSDTIPGVENVGSEET